ncbi:uncharacterized protein LOC108459019 [Gossypium arboreum]|uniref:uncharacterized protein LOC108459019 n=1 Tax=Gossypium arboreum TaxID=29729 RepID=UPI000818F826|nr:uncharacterized protein LOC108459019 [Gossypium arboreum]
MSNYVKFMKDILSKKHRLREFETVALTKGCTIMLKNKLSPKLKDPGSFTITYSIGNHYVGKVLCDSGASINLMPMSIFKKLEIGKTRSIMVTLQLAGQSYTCPEGKIEDVLVRVDKSIFPTDSLILEFKVDQNMPIILGRSFLTTDRTSIDLQKGELTMKIIRESTVITRRGPRGRGRGRESFRDGSSTLGHMPNVGVGEPLASPMAETKLYDRAAGDDALS